MLLSAALFAGFGVATWAPLAAHAALSAASWSFDESTAFQLNATHTGALANDSLTPPLIHEWSHTFPGAVSYPLIAGGRVFVTAVDTPGPGNTTSLYALDQATGSLAWGPVALAGLYPWSNATYEDGRVFVVNNSGQLTAFDASTGSQLWSVKLPIQYFFSAPPTAFGGIVFVGGGGSGGTLYAVSAVDGTLLWSDSVANGDFSSPSVSRSGVYVSYACNVAYDFDPLSGASIWLHPGPCEGGGGETAVLYGGQLYTRDILGDLVLDAASGTQTGTYTATPAPAFAGSTGFFLSGSTLTATDLSSHAAIWTFTGDGTLDSAPLVVNGVVYIGGSSGNLYAVNATTGTQIGSAIAAGTTITGQGACCMQPITGFGAGEGWLDVPAGSTLAAFTSALAIAPSDLHFGTQATGTSSSPAAVTITNHGATSATLTGFGTTGDFGQANSCSSPWPPAHRAPRTSRSPPPPADCGPATSTSPTASRVRTR